MAQKCDLAGCKRGPEVVKKEYCDGDAQFADWGEIRMEAGVTGAAGIDIITNERVRDVQKRAFRWRFGQILICLIYVGVLADISTTAVAVHRFGISYEQNPLAVGLINLIGWVGLYLLVTALCLVCYTSVKIVYWRMASPWSIVLNFVLMVMLTVRFLAVVTTVLYILNPTA